MIHFPPEVARLTTPKQIFPHPKLTLGYGCYGWWAAVVTGASDGHVGASRESKNSFLYYSI